MKSYPPPGSTDDLTAAEASQRVNEMNAAYAADPQHPAFCNSHPQSKDFAEYSMQLYTIIATAEAEAKDAVQAQELEAALEATNGLTPGECLSRAKMLMATPGYIDGSYTLDSKERAKLSKEINVLYLAASQQEPETSNPEKEEISDDL
jgi:hypothetical protein